MRAFHVVGVDFQLRLGRDAGRPAQQDIAALLPGVGALGVGGHVDHSAELPDSLPAGNTFDVGIAATIGDIVSRAKFHHAVLIARGEEYPAQFVFGIRAVEVDAVRGVGARQLHRRQAATAAGSLLHRDLGKRLGRKQFGQLQLRLLAQLHLHDRHVGRGMQHDDPRRSARRGLHAQMPGIDRRKGFGLGPGDAEHLAVRRAEPADDVGNRLHHLSYSLISQSYPSFSSLRASDLSPEWMMRPL